MKTTQIMLRFDAAKLKALEFYLPQNDTSVEDELKKRLDEIYTNEVPDAVKDFIRFQTGNTNQNDSPVENVVEQNGTSAKPSRRQRTSQKAEVAQSEMPDQTLTL